MKKIKIEVNISFSPHKYIYTFNNRPKDTDLDFRVNAFYGNGRYFFYYSGIFEKRCLKRGTWLLELILNRDKYKTDSFVYKPLTILEGVTKGVYEYKEIFVSAYLMRRLLKGSTKPETFNELEIYESDRLRDGFNS